MDMVAYMHGGGGGGVRARYYEMDAHTYFKVCLTLIFIGPESDHCLPLSLTN